MRLKQRGIGIMFAGLVGVIGYLGFWPIPFTPQAWQAPHSAGLVGPFAPNQKLHAVEIIPLPISRAPETIAKDAQGNLYTGTLDGEIIRFQSDGINPKVIATTHGRPLGMDLDRQGTLWIADSFLGLMKMIPGGRPELMITQVGVYPLRFLNAVQVAKDGRVYFTNSSTVLSPKKWGGTYATCVLDLMEHVGHGQLLVYDPATQKTQILLDHLVYANGVALSEDQQFLLVNDTGNYRVLRYWLQGPKQGSAEPIIENLPGFPDNITTGLNGRFWIGLVSPRNASLDWMSNKPWLRRIVLRLPKLFWPKDKNYLHVVGIDGEGKVIISLQDPNPQHYFKVSGATETTDYLYLHSLESASIARLKKRELMF